MRFVFDANILMAILIGGRAFHRVILETFDVITPDFALTEIDKYSPLIIQKTKLAWPEHSQFAHLIFANVSVIPRYLIETDSVKKATELVGEIDSKDISYVAFSYPNEHDSRNARQTDCRSSSSSGIPTHFTVR